MKKLLITLLLLSISAQVWGRDYFVRTDGNSDRCSGLVDAADTGNGSNQPCAWGDAGATKSIAKVNAFTYASNDIINFRRGDTFSDTYLHKAQTNLTFRAYGTNSTPPKLTGAVGDSYSAQCNGNNQTYEGLWFSGKKFHAFGRSNLVIHNCIFSDHDNTSTKAVDIGSGTTTFSNNLLINNKSAGFATTGTATVSNNIFFGTGSYQGPIYLPGAGTVTYNNNIFCGGTFNPSSNSLSLSCYAAGGGICSDGGNNKYLTDAANNYPKFRQTQYPVVPKITLRMSDDPKHFVCMMNSLKDYGVKASMAPAYGFVQAAVVPTGSTTTNQCVGGPYSLSDLQSLIDSGYAAIHVRSGSGNKMNVATNVFSISTTNTGVNTLKIDGTTTKTLTLTSIGNPSKNVTLDWSTVVKYGNNLTAALAGKDWSIVAGNPGLVSNYYRLSSLKDTTCTSFPCAVSLDDHTGNSRWHYDESTAAAATIESLIGRTIPKKVFTYPYGEYEAKFITYLANNTDYIGATGTDVGDVLTTAAYLPSINVWKMRSINTPILRAIINGTAEQKIRAGVRAIWGWAVGAGGVINLYQHNTDLTLQEMTWAVDEFNKLGVEWVFFGDLVESIKADHANPSGDKITYTKSYKHGDYNLTNGSPAVEAGSDTGLTTDILGSSYLGLPDIGPYGLVDGWIPMSNLTVTLAGPGGGRVTGLPAIVDCSSGVCLYPIVPFTQTSLYATPNPGSVFTGWSGACTGTSTCSLPMDNSAEVTATFETTISTQAVSVPALGPAGVLAAVAGLGMILRRK